MVLEVNKSSDCVTTDKSTKKDSFESLLMEHVRLNGANWGLTTLDLLYKLHAVEADEFIEWIMSCYHPDSGSARRGGID
uniref:Uncharacterized protein n=1 Tax=Oryza meridionalis TaxID=40149 RepID=A0A0E0D4L0_9ORYZ